ncbi:DUF6003 family protein [Streptomyces sp. NPDC008122]|uniref:DUF6003 family protein n=1 Tax=Streptomyces sp. NPDC008122 TaxID=3364810 RepID=UPI0036F01C13
MADDAFLFLLHERHPRLGAALAAVGDLECSETPAVHGRLQAHGVSASSEEVGILPFDAAEFIPEGTQSCRSRWARTRRCAWSRRARRGRSRHGDRPKPRRRRCGARRSPTQGVRHADAVAGGHPLGVGASA